MADGQRPYIECQDLFKIYKRADLEVVALRGLDFRVQPGEMLAVLGASGSGKTTLLNILAGLDRPSAGQVRVGPWDLLEMANRDLVDYRRREVGFLWQSTGRNLLPYLSARGNVEMPLAISGQPASERRARAVELLTMVGLGNKTERLPYQLSGGEQQRVGIAVALANRPPLLLADEPTGELDTQTAREVLDALRAVNTETGTTIIIVSHFTGVGEFVSRVVLIRDGRISREILAMPTYRAPGETEMKEYLVVDRVGRLQLPQEHVDQLKLGGLAIAEVREGEIVIRPSQEGSGA